MDLPHVRADVPVNDSSPAVNHRNQRCGMMGGWGNRPCSIGVLLAAIGCSQGPSRIDPPSIDVETAAAQAIELYDKNGDEKLSKEELSQCPGVEASLTLYDTNGDQAVDRAEFAQRLGELLRSRVGLTNLRSRVTYQGRPLSDAVVVLEPEPYLGSEVQTATGTTDANGSASLGIAAENLPSNLQGRKLVHCGTYKVRITHPKIKLPAKYNTQTTLGYETRLGDPFAAFALTAR
jgi:hypothetical protein